jgi:hypothetical protein
VGGVLLTWRQFEGVCAPMASGDVKGVHPKSSEDGIRGIGERVGEAVINRVTWFRPPNYESMCIDILEYENKKTSIIRC